jgi:hypothetical protein
MTAITPNPTPKVPPGFKVIPCNFTSSVIRGAEGVSFSCDYEAIHTPREFIEKYGKFSYGESHESHRFKGILVTRIDTIAVCPRSGRKTVYGRFDSDVCITNY